MVRQPAFVALESLYPEHAEYIKEGKCENHRKLAQQLQRLESSIVIDGVCGYLMQHYPEMPVLTIHDELVVPQQIADIVQKLIEQQFSMRGVSARLTKENLL